MADVFGAQRRVWRSGLAARFTALAGLLLAAVAAAIVAVMTFEARRDASERAVADLARDIGVVAEALGHTNDPHSVVQRLAARPGVVYAVLTARDGAVLGGAAPYAPPPEVSRETLAETGGESLAAIVAADDVAHASKLVTLPGHMEATLRVGASLAGAQSAASGAATGGLLAALLALVVGLPAFALMVGRALGPMRLLARAMSRVGSDAAILDLASVRRDEIGALARAHIEMSRQVSESAAALRRLAFDDALTRLPNREAMKRRLTGALEVGRSVALVKIELRGLDRVIAGLGPAGGEAATRSAAERLGEAAAAWRRRLQAVPALGDGGEIFLARTGEAQFALIADGAGESAAEELARLALDAFEAPLRLDEHRVALSISVGVAHAPEHGSEAETLMRSAQAALAAARAAGGSVARIAGAELNDRAYSRLRIEQELRRAIAEGELEVHYQPQVALPGGVVVGVEALVRWRHPTRGLVPPVEFVTVAEETGLIEPLGRFVLTEACRRVARWAEMGLALRVAVNVSALQLRNPDFAQTTLDVIRGAGADPRLIELEITESAAMADPAQAARELAPLRAAGVRIAIDDFGTGYSNLAALTHLPFDVLKIDRSFVRDALITPGARIVVEAVLGLAYNLSVDTVAEGVETEEQSAFVTAGGCTFGQGYLFGRPMPAEAFEAWYADRLGSELRAFVTQAAAKPVHAHPLFETAPQFAR